MYDLDPPMRSEPSIRDEARLAAAVVRQALVDALGGPHVRPELAEDARRFLAGGAELEWWCGVARLDPHVVGALAQRTLAEGPGPGRTVGEPRRLSRS